MGTDKSSQVFQRWGGVRSLLDDIMPSRRGPRVRFQSLLHRSSDDHGGFMGFGSFRQKQRENNLALYENEPQQNFLNALVGGYTTPGPQERAASKNAKAKVRLLLILTMVL